MSVPANVRLNHLSAASPNLIVECLNYLAVIGNDSNVALKKTKKTELHLRVTPPRRAKRQQSTA